MRHDTIDKEYATRMGLRNEWVSDITIKQNVSFYIIAIHKGKRTRATHNANAIQQTHIFCIVRWIHACSFDSVVKDTRNCNKLHGCDLKIELLLALAYFGSLFVLLLSVHSLFCPFLYSPPHFSLSLSLTLTLALTTAYAKRYCISNVFSNCHVEVRWNCLWQITEKTT